jgi:hypothetical protein
MLNDRMINELERLWKEVDPRYHPDICLERLRKTMKTCTLLIACDQIIIIIGKR